MVKIFLESYRVNYDLRQNVRIKVGKNMITIFKRKYSQKIQGSLKNFFLTVKKMHKNVFFIVKNTMA